jgi:RNA polymerase sigma-70 factor (ECF subfamily)
VKAVAGATSVSELASAIGVREQESAIVAELKAGSEDAYAWLIRQYHQPIYSLVYRLLDDPSDAPDTTQEVFLKVFRGIKRFHGESSLKTWIYRIAVHEASNRRRWWFRHKVREMSMEPAQESESPDCRRSIRDTLVDGGESPLQTVLQEEVRARVEQELKQLQEPYRTTVILRDIDEMSYEQIAEVMGASLGTVKSRLVRGRDALRKRLERYARDLDSELGLNIGSKSGEAVRQASLAGQRTRKVEVTP